jgi:hypothetical protein
MRRRTLAAIAGSAVALTSVSLGIHLAVATSPGTPRASGESGAVTPPAAGRSPFACPRSLELPTPPFPDPAVQRRVAERVAELDFPRVRHAAPTALGVVALVDDLIGDADLRADPAVAERLARFGVAHTYEWDPSSSGVGIDRAGQVRRVLQWELAPAMRQVRHATRHARGSAGLAVWAEAGAIVLRWKAPVPPQVRDLAGAAAGGAHVVVRSTTYSHTDVRRAQRRLSSWLRETGRQRQWSSAAACADGSGLVVGLSPSVADRPGLAEEIGAAVGMPVHVVPEDLRLTARRQVRSTGTLGAWTTS